MSNTALQPIGAALSAFQFSTTGTLFVGGLNSVQCWLPHSSGGKYWGTKYEATSGPLKDIGCQYNALVNECAKIAKGAHYVKTRWGNANISTCNDRKAIQVGVSPVGERVGDSIKIYMGHERGNHREAELRYRAKHDEFSIYQFARPSDKIKATAISVGGKFLEAVGMEPAASGNEAWKNTLASIQDGKVTPTTAFYIASMMSRRTDSIPTLAAHWRMSFKEGLSTKNTVSPIDKWLDYFNPKHSWLSDDYVHAETLETAEAGYDWRLIHLQERTMPREMVRYVHSCSNAYAEYPVINIVHNASINPQHFITDLIEAAAKMRPDVFPLAR